MTQIPETFRDTMRNLAPGIQEAADKFHRQGGFRPNVVILPVDYRPWGLMRLWDMRVVYAEVNEAKVAWEVGE